MNPGDSIGDDDILQGLIADFLDAVNRGEQFDRAALLKRHPEYADALRDFFSDHDRMASAAFVGPETLPLNPNPGDQLTMPLASVTSDSGQQFKTSPGAVRQNQANVGDRVRYFGDYELLSELARGGMGVVYKARQINLNRLVAVKMILAGQLASEEDVSRFYMEAEAAANLDHPGIVPIYEIGQHEGQHFFAMGFVEGQSLQQRIQDGPLPPREAAELTLKVAEAIHFAHEKGVIHRDLKPANILLDSKGEPKVTDFGLARKLEQDSGLTKTGAVMGTPSYMPPEQASGKTDEVGPLADVYSLGAILYCLLTGRPPFQAANPLDTLLQVLEKEPVSVQSLNAGVPRDLETICHKCLQKDPAKRYVSAQELVDELGRWQRGEPIRARAVSGAEKAWRWVQRNRTVSSLVAVTLFAIVGGACFAVAFGLEAKRSEELAKESAQEARNAATELRIEKERARHSQYVANINLAHQYITSFNPKAAVRALEEVVPAVGDNDYRDFEYYYMQNTLAQAEIERLRNMSIEDLWREIEAATDTEQFEQTLKVVFELRDDISVDMSPENTKWLEEAVRKYLDPYSVGGVLSDIIAVAVSHDNRIVAECDTYGRVFLRDVKSLDRQQFQPKSPMLYYAVAFNSDGKLLVGIGTNQTVTIWDVANGNVKATFSDHDSMVLRADISDDDRLLATGCGDGSVYLWDIDSGNLVGKRQVIALPQLQKVNADPMLNEEGLPRLTKAGMIANISAIDSLEFGGGDKWLRCCTGFGDVSIMNVARFASDKEPQRFLEAKFIGQTDFILTVTSGRISIIELSGKTPPKQLLEFKDSSYQNTPIIAVSNDGLLAAISLDNIVTTWNLKTLESMGRWETNNLQCESMAVSPSNKRLAVLNSDNSVQMIDLLSGKQVMSGLFDSIDVKQWATKKEIKFSSEGEFLFVATGEKLQVARGKSVSHDSNRSETAIAIASDLVSNEYSHIGQSLKRLGLAIFKYEEVMGRFPDSATESKAGKPLLSWRVSLLPFLDEKELFDEFRHDEPWDSEHNSALIERMPDVFAQAKSHTFTLFGRQIPTGHTNYHLPVAPGTIFENGKGCRFHEITDGTSNTVLIVQSAESPAVPWTMPLKTDTGIEHWISELSSLERLTQVALADGVVRTLAPEVNQEELRKLLLRNDGKIIDHNIFR